MNFDPGFDIRVHRHPLGFDFGPGVFGPKPEYRRLDSIRQCLHNPDCAGPDPVYAIVMDVGKEQHRQDLNKRMLLFGAVTYAAGRLGRESVRSQGHVHRIATHNGWRPPEIYEIWFGRAVVYMQESDSDHPGRCFAVTARAGDVVVVPPAWAHATLSASVDESLAFGAWCDREYGFDYSQVRAHRGLAWYAFLDDGDQLTWHKNPAYVADELIIGPPRDYRELGLRKGTPVYSQFEHDPESVQWVSDPARVEMAWRDFVPCHTETTVRSG